MKDESMKNAIKAINDWIEILKTEATTYDKKIKKYDAYLAIKTAIEIKKEYFYRCTNRREEYYELKKGEKITSKNHANGHNEIGLSVCDTLAYSMHGYKYVYKIKGKVIGNGSDGEPLLIDACPIGRLMLTKTATKNDKERAKRITIIKEIAEKTNLKINQIQALLFDGENVFSPYSSPEIGELT